MKLDPRALVRATIGVMVLSYAVCFVFAAIAPRAAMTLFGDILHTDLGVLTPRLGVGVFVEGLLLWSGFAGVAAWLTAWVYNRSVHA